MTTFHVKRLDLLSIILLSIYLFCSSGFAADCDEQIYIDGFEAKPTVCDPSPPLTYKLSESTAAVNLWTTPVANKVRNNETAPASQQNAQAIGLLLHAAKHEFEPVQLIIGPVAGGPDATISVSPFANLGVEQRIDLAVAAYQDGWPEDLNPFPSGSSIPLSSTQPTVIWFTVYVPPNAPAGDHETTITLAIAGQPTVNIPLKLYVFDFALPQQISFATQFNIGINQPQHEFKQRLFEHRLTPKSVPWPSGFTYNITWDSGNNPNRCEQFYDEPDEGAEYSIGTLGPRYILGQGWNNIGFPNAMLFQFVNNSTPRPDTFCGINRGGDHFGTSSYNNEWSQFLTALQNYLNQNGMLDKGYHYVMNEPQNQGDYDVAAHLCRLSKTAAPNLRIAVSEEPKPEIAEHAAGACGYDIWIAHIGSYQEAYARQRQRDHDETVWFYSLPQDAEPFFNPTIIEKQGMDVRIIPWIAWRYRITGWAYYDGNSFFNGREPGVRAELLREGLEDYEYLYLANGGRHPRVDVNEPGDTPALSAAKTFYSWTRDADALMALRYQLGLYLEGKRNDLPTLERQGNRPRGEYYLNFQDPTGQPTANPLIVDSKTYMKIGWQPYDEQLGYGWRGQFINADNGANILLYGYRSNASGYSEVEKSYVYDDYGRLNLFEFDLENGRYQVTVAVNRAGVGHSNRHNVTLEGVKIVDDVQSNDLIVRSEIVDLSDGSLSLEIGGKSATTGDFSYTFLDYLDIVPVEP